MSQLPTYELVPITMGWVSLAHYLWTKRHSVAGYGAWLEGLRRPHTGCELGHADKMATARQRALQDAIGRLRVANFKSASRHISPYVLLTLFLCLILWHTSIVQRPDDSMHSVLLLFFLISLISIHLLLVVVQDDWVDLTEAKVDGLVSGLHIFVSIRIFFLPNCLQAFTCLSPIRALWRVMFGLILLDWKKSAVLNLISLLAQATKLYTMSQTMVLERLPALLMGELFTFALSTALCHVGEVWMRDLVAAKLDVLTLQNSQLAARKLLSVLCDADVLLGRDFKILTSSMKLCHLLMRGSGGSQAMDGMDFCSCIIESDRRRFHEFIASSMMLQDDTSQPVPAASLHLNLRDSAGLNVPVRVFHVAVPNLGCAEGLSHLIGVKDEGNIYDSADNPSFPQVTRETNHQLVDALRMFSADTEAQDDLASGCSSEDWSCALDKVVMDVDALSRNLKIRSATLHFKSHEDGPGLIDFLSSSSQTAVLSATQDVANDCLESKSASYARHEKKLALRWPGANTQVRMKCTRLLCSADAPTDEDYTELPMKLEFLDLSQCYRSGSSVGLGTVASSTGGLLPRILEGVTAADAEPQPREN